MDPSGIVPEGTLPRPTHVNIKPAASPADWCWNCKVYGKSIKLGTVIVLDELVNLSMDPSRIVPWRSHFRPRWRWWVPFKLCSKITTSFGLEASNYAFDWPPSAIITNGMTHSHSDIFWNNNNDEPIMTIIITTTAKNGGRPCRKKSFYWKRKITSLLNVSAERRNFWNTVTCCFGVSHYLANCFL